jgi:putative nucleotidyltransferase with HDIG domain
MPEVREISNSDLKRKCLETWLRALPESSFHDLTEVPGENWIDPNISQLDHQRAVARMAVAVADAIEEIVSTIKFDKDVLIVGALVHDVGKVFEYDPVRTTVWRKQPQAAGYPSIRHPIYGVHLGLAVGLPETVLHIIAAHAKEGALVRRSLENTLISVVDRLFWEIAATSRTGRTFDELQKAEEALETLPISSAKNKKRRGK